MNAGIGLDARRNMKILIADKLGSTAKLALEDIGHEVQESPDVTSEELKDYIKGI